MRAGFLARMTSKGKIPRDEVLTRSNFNLEDEE